MITTRQSFKLIIDIFLTTFRWVLFVLANQIQDSRDWSWHGTANVPAHVAMSTLPPTLLRLWLDKSNSGGGARVSELPASVHLTPSFTPSLVPCFFVCFQLQNIPLYCLIALIDSWRIKFNSYLSSHMSALRTYFFYSRPQHGYSWCQFSNYISLYINIFSTHRSYQPFPSSPTPWSSYFWSSSRTFWVTTLPSTIWHGARVTDVNNSSLKKFTSFRPDKSLENVHHICKTNIEAVWISGVGFPQTKSCFPRLNKSFPIGLSVCPASRHDWSPRQTNSVQTPSRFLHLFFW